MEAEKDGVPAFYAKDQQAWRQWLEGHHDSAKSVWLIVYRKESGTPSVYYPEAVDEALCFGWIDSKSSKRDGESFYLFFARRNPRSNWSRLNKQKVEVLLAAGRMATAGLAVIEAAKKSGTWTALDDVENLTLSPDLEAALRANPIALQYFEAFPRSAKRGILEWLLNAKRPETRRKRIEEIVSLAAQNIRANQYHP